LSQIQRICRFLGLRSLIGGPGDAANWQAHHDEGTVVEQHTRILPMQLQTLKTEGYRLTPGRRAAVTIRNVHEILNRP
jgi:hypothetical protein